MSRKKISAEIQFELQEAVMKRPWMVIKDAVEQRAASFAHVILRGMSESLFAMMDAADIHVQSTLTFTMVKELKIIRRKEGAAAFVRCSCRALHWAVRLTTPPDMAIQLASGLVSIAKSRALFDSAEWKAFYDRYSYIIVDQALQFPEPKDRDLPAA